MSTGIDLVELVARQRTFSDHTFGPSYGADRIADHILKEVAEVADTPDVLEEWADIILLGLDGAWRAGYGPREIAETICVRFADVALRQVYWSCRAMSLEAHIRRQNEHISRYRRSGSGVKDVLTAIRYEIYTLSVDSQTLQPWLTIVFLGLTGACLTGQSPESIERAIAEKLQKNEQRKWPDWRTVGTDRAIEHINN